MIYIGLPQWSHPKWVRLGITSLEEYARHFNCVEGNTTLYALPKPEVVLRWREQTTLGNTGCNCLPHSAHGSCLRFGIFSILFLANLIMAWKSAIHSFSPKEKRNKRLIAVYISAALIG